MSTLDATQPLDFGAKIDGPATSWRRADPTRALIKRIAWNWWLVTLPDGEEAHAVRLETDHGAFLGECWTLDEDGDHDEACPGFAYHDGPCAHICTIRKAAFGHVEDIDGNRVRIFDVEEVAQARADQAVEEIAARTDGGRPL